MSAIGFTVLSLHCNDVTSEVGASFIVSLPSPENYIVSTVLQYVLYKLDIF